MTPDQDERRYYARSASDRTDEWPFWFVADKQQGGLNVTVRLFPGLEGCLPFVDRRTAVAIAADANSTTRLKY
ncbi:hypothetical protein J5N58_01410 [Rhizobium cremeum]|uniref:hypothetical protein n=1 Tax=Rhizobium cremeum TaxID=2813827 RepID=UPI000DDFFD98|nr:hypothetical protein [Rhizobium cremeum]MCJ7993255.1 hypothetical protein [Rhizobium cremeum]MCJ7998320.1 hypothetical protein [Rhizobium cremeum]